MKTLEIEGRKAWLLYEKPDKRLLFFPKGWHKFLMAGFGFMFLSSSNWVTGLVVGIPLGFFLGCLLDMRLEEDLIPAKPADLGMTFMMLATAVMQANGMSPYTELRYTYQYLSRQFGSDYVRSRKHLFENFARQQLPVEGLCDQLDYHLSYPAKLQFIYFLIGLAYSDGHLGTSELRMIGLIADGLHLQPADFESILAMHQREKPGSAYTVLEVTSTATNEEIKQAYYTLAQKHHPDKVAHMGNEYVANAKEKFQKISEAYREIRKQRGF